MSPNKSEIVDFFKNQTIFLTGASGFLGKILIEKLLRTCPDLAKIYILMRAKKGKTPDQRFNELFDFPCFERLKSMNPQAFQKVNLLIGDCQKPDLGLSEQNLEILKEETTCVIHAAANVKFDATLKEQGENVKGTRDLLELAKSMTKLRVFVYVSTAFSNCLNMHIKEEFYKPPTTAEDLLALVNNLNEEELQNITPNVLGKWPNTYVYTKSISEDLVRRASEDLPVTIVRPAIVASTCEEPMPGWVDNFYGVVGISVGAGLGVLRSLHCKKDATAYIVPADYVSNCILAAAWNRAKSDQSPTIYNYVGHKNNFITWRRHAHYLEALYWTQSSEKAVWYYTFKLRENKLCHKLAVFFYHTVVAYIADFALMCVGRPTLAVKNYERLNKMIDLISPFSANNWTFDTDNVVALWQGMTDIDKKMFKFDMEDLDWETCYLRSVEGGRLYLLKDTPDTIPKGRRKFQILFCLHYTFLAVFYYFIYKFLMFIFSVFWQSR